ncbi:hypothetical protein POV27_04495 [Aureisphaera galaxeae]|uniref:hypothetical protein n=1 Tax=Aureisphaera galaxeae TaxID=1538023 RepID=UPI002350A077|nr:hypothetical protein [Aureisphaera galaxeae]MDC8003296.1 hypothetical protein [Aureisphaera galaxeae]
MKEVAKYYIEDKFIITGRGLVFAGHIMEGDFITGDIIEFPFMSELLRRKVLGIEFSRNPIRIEDVDKRKTGVLVDSIDEDEMKRIRHSDFGGVEARIYSDR